MPGYVEKHPAAKIPGNLIVDPLENAPDAGWAGEHEATIELVDGTCPFVVRDRGDNTRHSPRGE